MSRAHLETIQQEYSKSFPNRVRVPAQKTTDYPILPFGPSSFFPSLTLLIPLGLSSIRQRKIVWVVKRGRDNCASLTRSIAPVAMFILWDERSRVETYLIGYWKERASWWGVVTNDLVDPCFVDCWYCWTLVNEMRLLNLRSLCQLQVTRLIRISRIVDIAELSNWNDRVLAIIRNK